ncbi:hypothetical protein SAMN05216302_100854 [Nitrosomonas aestuarii]|uniref:Uncharacterized protein n=1 Tax=Nitrosomonas aestuarii TaxID=52441 RepID=A0A1I4A6V2_9PROT|nr:hypothetical protein [Nitrosomonas aestuarii]SFK52063.1 hypothetical protein SAMN05216302_100854 [Nitrosomonas aestuarii]
MFDKHNQLVFYANILIIVFGATVILFSDFTLVGFLIIAGGAVLMYEQFKQNQGTFRISGVEKVLTIKDTCGTRATVKQQQKTTACHVDNNVYWFKNIASSGSIGNFSINGQFPIEQVKDKHSKYQVCMALPTNPTKATKGIDTILSYDYTNAFGRTKGELSHVIDDETDQVKLVVDLPKGRPIASARAYCKYNGTEEALLPPVITGETRIETEIENPKLGAEYCLQWTWPEANIIKKITCYLK